MNFMGPIYNDAMPKEPTALNLAAIAPNPASSQSLVQQLYENLRTAVLDGRLPVGMRLPASRLLAAELGLARNTVVTAYEQLMAEGYLESRTGDGTYVSRALPDELLTVAGFVHPGKSPPPAADQRLSIRSQALATANLGPWGQDRAPQPFRPDLLALDHFPIDLWGRLVSRQWREATLALLSYSEPAGLRALREEVAAYLGAARGVRCTAEQVLITAGAQQGIDLAARVLLNPGDQVWFENPGYRGARGALMAADAALIPAPVDEEGIDIAYARQRAPHARAAYVTPSHQYPTGVTMSLARRLALLEWAEHTGAWVIEDDYDSEYRYNCRPLAALQGLDRAGRVIYLGTFSKVLFPSLRLGYLVVPPAQVDAFIRMRALSDRQSPTIDQAVVAAFLREGHFARHIRRMRALYAERQAALVEAAPAILGNRLTIRSADAGLHVVGWLPPGVDDQAVAGAGAAAGIDAPAVTNYALAPLPQGGLILGYAALTPAQITEGLHRLAHVLADFVPQG